MFQMKIYPAKLDSVQEKKLSFMIKFGNPVFDGIVKMYSSKQIAR